MNEKGKLKRVVSMRKREANRRNALRSTGPRTPMGKGAVRWNALKHGILAKQIVIPAGEGRENGAAFRYLLAQLRRALAPAGVLEEILVEKIATCYWRLGRVLRAEAAEVQKGISEAAEERERNVRVLAKLLNAGFSRGSWRGGGTLSPELSGHTTVESAECSGEDSALQAKLRILDSKDSVTSSKECAHLALERACRVLPGSATVEKILRYETTIERELYRALHQLERMQRRRNGEPVLPPVSVEFSGVA